MNKRLFNRKVGVDSFVLTLYVFSKNGTKLKKHTRGNSDGHIFFLDSLTRVRFSTSSKGITFEHFISVQKQDV